MARTYKNAIKMRLNGKLYSNDMTLAEKVAWLIYIKHEMKKNKKKDKCLECSILNLEYISNWKILKSYCRDC